VSALRALTAAAPRLAAVLLGAACVAWTAVPPRHTGLAALALVVSIIAVVAGALRLALADVPQPEDGFFPSAPVRAWLTFLAVLRGLPWEEIAVVALLWLEVQHPARPWHTAALGFGLAAYLLAVHIAESGAPAGRLLRRQAKVLLAGACLLALGAGFAMLPAAGPGAGSALLRVLAAAAVVAAAALVLPGRD
jgi:phosphatidylserine synthase